MPTAQETASIKTVAVIGAGYVGLPLCLYLAKAGVRVTAVDISENVVRQINQRTWKIDEEKEFETMFRDRDVQANLRAQTTPVQADVFVIAVPTPVHHHDNSPDVDAVIAATESVVPFVQPGNLVVVESTIPPGTTDGVVKEVLERSGYSVGEEIYLAHCPERILPGNIMAEFMNNARLLGGVSLRSAQKARDLYSLFSRGKLFVTDARTAEMVKLMENSYRDVNVAFANQIAILCDKLGIDPFVAISLANQHPRVKILNPGIGVGGHCIPVDPWFLVHYAPEDTPLLRAARQINDCMPHHAADRILKSVQNVKDPKIVLVGATYKPNVKDLRESPAIAVFDILKEKSGNVSLCDPMVPEYPCDSVLAVARGADALAILVPHDLVMLELKYRRAEILAAMRRPNLIDFSPTVS
jgi:UDP-N-acetyl-D-mannosaminuronic acid dehydrogenase